MDYLRPVFRERRSLKIHICCLNDRFKGNNRNDWNQELSWSRVTGRETLCSNNIKEINKNRRLYCVEWHNAAYARSTQLSVYQLFTSCIRRCRVSRACDWVMSALSAALQLTDYFIRIYRVGQKSDTSRTMYYIVRAVSLFWPTLYIHTYFQFTIQSAFLPYIGRQAAPALQRTIGFNEQYRTSDVA